MKEVRWVYTGQCRKRAHCPTCRDLEGGRWWREKRAETYELPNGEIDFACPHGIPWGAGPQVSPDATPEQKAKAEAVEKLIQARLAICRNCDELGTTSAVCDKAFPDAAKRCGWRRFVIAGQCPLGLWGPDIISGVDK